VDGIHKGLGQQIYCVRVNTLTNLMDVVFLFLLLPRFGIGGYFFTYTLTHVVNFYLSIRKLLQLAELRLSPGFLLGVCVAVLTAALIVCLFVSAGLNWVGTLIRGGIYLVLLALLLTLTGTIDKVRRMP